MSFLYNPDRMSEQEIRDTFVARSALVDTLLQIIKRQPDGAGVQHAIVTGPRGMGKTTVLLMVQFQIAELGLSEVWQAVKFPEEAYSINDLADLWLETLHLLAATTGDRALESQLSALRGMHPPAEELREHAWALIKDWSTAHGKRLVLLIDNFDMIVEQINDGNEKDRLRNLLMNDGTVMIIGTAVSFFKEAHYDKPFYHFFRLFDLTGLNHEDVIALLKRRAEIDGIKDFDKILAESQGRFRALEYFTGGNPRLILMLYRVVTEWGSTEVRKALEKLLDEVTPYYKSRTEVLPPQQRKILDHIARESARSFEGLSPTDIAAATRMKPNQASTQLKRLAEAGYVRSAAIKGRASCYTLAEPLYAIWYQMRFSRTAKERMLWLVGFLKIWFELPQLLKEAESVRYKVGDFCKIGEREKACSILEHGKYLLEAMPDGPEKVSATNEFLKSQMIAEDWENIREIAENADLSKLSDEEIDILFKMNGIGKKDYLAEKANRAFYAQRFDEAQGLIAELLQIQPNSFEASNSLGVVFAEKGLYAKAIELYDKAVQIKPDSHVAWYNRGNALFYLGRFKEAINSYNNALEADPAMHDAWSNKGNALAELGHFDEAIQAWDKALQIKPEMHESWHNRGIALDDSGQFLEAIESFDKALKIKPDKFTAWYNRGNSYTNLRRFKEAIESYDNALRIKHDIHEAWFNRGNAFDELGQFKEALESYDNALKIKPDKVSAWNNKGYILIKLGKYQDALNAFNQAAFLSNDRVPWENYVIVSVMLAIHSLSNHQPDQALHYLTESRKSEPIIGSDQWASLVLKTLLKNISVEKLPDIRTLILHAGLDQQFFPLLRAIDYLETGNEELIEKLSPEYRKIVLEVAEVLKGQEPEEKRNQEVAE